MEKDYKELYEDIINILKNDGYDIKYIKNPTEEMKLTAVKEDPYAIKYIDNPSEEVQILAVMEEESVIRYIKKPTDKVKELARKIEEQNDYKKKYEELVGKLKNYINK